MPKNLKAQKTKIDSNVMSITEQLIEKYGFHSIKKYSSQRDEIDIDQFSCMLRVHVIHYLFYSEVHKHFSIGVRHENPKKNTNGELQEWTTIMLPKPIHSFKEAKQLISSITSVNLLQLY